MGNFDVEEKTYTITLADGSQLTNLRLNGNNFVSETLVERSQFTGKLYEVSINDGMKTDTYQDMTLLQIAEYTDGWYFILAPIDKEEKMRSDIDYIAMLYDVDLDIGTGSAMRALSAHSPKYEKVKKYYETCVWPIDRVRTAVGKWITETEYEEITGRLYSR